ncbi:MAG: helicase-associated domain-containing protein [Corynebacterium sp.]|nr:helicase-associated domain-containing protein [Corynebacterium sp.]
MDTPQHNHRSRTSATRPAFDPLEAGASFTDYLESLDDETLGRLLHIRGVDALSFSQLAARLGAPAGLSLFIRTLNARQRLLLDLVAESMVAAREAGEKIHPLDTPELVERAITRLRNCGIEAPEHSVWLAEYQFLVDSGLIYAGLPQDSLLLALRRLQPTSPEPGMHLNRASMAERIAQISDPRQERVLHTLARNSVGRSSKVNQPGHPIHSLVEQGLLLQLDEETVRAPWMLRDLLSSTPASFEQDYMGTNSAPEQRPLPDTASVADLLWCAHGLLLSDIELKQDETVGVRERARLEKDFGPHVPFVLELLESAGYLNPDGGHYARTRTGQLFLEASWATQWSLLIERWCQNAQEHMALARALAAGQSLFFYCPDSMVRLSAEVYAEMQQQAAMLGILQMNNGQPIGTTIVDALEDPQPIMEQLLPTGAMLIPQADLTILTTGPLTFDQEVMLRAMASLESPGIASVWRLSPDSIDRALGSGVSANAMVDFLRSSSPALPEAISYQIQDRARAFASLSTGRAASYVTGDEQEISRVRDYILSQGGDARIIAPTVLVSHAHPGTMNDWLRAGGFRATVDDQVPAARRMDPTGPIAPDMSVYPPLLSDDEVADTLTALRSHLS